MKNIIIFASGSGTNAENLVNYYSNKEHAMVSHIFTNNPNAKVIERASRLKVPIHIFTKDEMNNGSLLNCIVELKTDLIVLAGFLWLIPENIIKAFPNRIINIHPALLPAYGGKGMYGMKVHESVVSNHEKETGITVHYVNEKYDDGAVILQEYCRVLADDIANSVAEKIHQLEYKYFPIAVDKIIELL